MALASPTFGQLIDQVLTYLHGHTADLEQLTSLSGAIDSSQVSFAVTDSTQITRGLIEIDSELMWVTTVDQSTNTVYVAFRGFRETNAAAHNSGAMVINTPRFPRLAIAQAIQQTIYAVYPDLFAVKKDETQSSSPVVTSYQLPADCDLVLDISWQSVGPTKDWVKIRRWDIDTDADTTSFSTGKSIDIYDQMAPGRTIKVVYIAQPGQLSAETDALSSTGLSDSVSDVLIYGACYRLLANLEVSRLQTVSLQQSERDTLVGGGAALAASRYFFGLYEQALQREALRLQKFYSTRSHLVR